MNAATIHRCLRPLALSTVSLLSGVRQELALARPSLSASLFRRNATVAPARTAATEFYVPTIDIAPFLTDPNCPAAESIVSQVRSACVSTGFFQITGHGVPRALQKSVFDAAANFFALPFEEKKKLDASTTVGHRGYDVLGTQSYEAGVLPDLKEGFYVGTEIPLSDPRVQARRFFMGPNVWPPFSLQPTASFRDPILEYYSAMYALSLRVLDLIAATLPHGPSVFDDFKSNGPAAPLRLLHYPPAPPKSDSAQSARQFGASAHTDFGAITLLLQDGNEGLEVLNQNAGEWVPIPSSESGGYVVNIGDMLSAWTAGTYKSSVHRVINKSPGDRYSAVFFFDGNLDTSLAPLDGRPTDEQVKTVEQHMLERMGMSYGTKGK